MEQDVPVSREAKLAVTPTGLTALRCPEIARPLLTLVFRSVEGMGYVGTIMVGKNGDVCFSYGLFAECLLFLMLLSGYYGLKMNYVVYAPLNLNKQQMMLLSPFMFYLVWLSSCFYAPLVQIECY